MIFYSRKVVYDNLLSVENLYTWQNLPILTTGVYTMKKIVLIVLIVLVMVTSACTKDEIQSTGSEAVQSLTTGRTSIENSVIEFVQETGNCDTSVWPNNCQ